MFSTLASPSTMYQRVDVESSIDEAAPLHLVVMLYDGVVRHINEAIAALRVGDIAAKGKAITKANRILEEGLRASLNQSAGNISRNLNDLYIYMSQRLITAHRHNDQTILEEVLNLLRPIRDAWKTIERNQAK